MPSLPEWSEITAPKSDCWPNDDCECDEIFQMLFSDCIGECECPNDEVQVETAHHHHIHHHHLKVCKEVERKRKLYPLLPSDLESTDGSLEIGDASGRLEKKMRFDWDEYMHKKFLAAIFEIGLQSAAPKLLLEKMENMPSNFRVSNVKSHLQKYRQHTKEARALFLEELEHAYEMKREETTSHKELFRAFPISAVPTPE